MVLYGRRPENLNDSSFDNWDTVQRLVVFGKGELCLSHEKGREREMG